jgi:hypothetical protein
MKTKGMVTVVMYVTKIRDRNAIQRSYRALQMAHKAMTVTKVVQFSLEVLVESL